MTKISRLADSLAAVAGALMARAFQDDPLMAYTIPAPDDRRRMLAEFYTRMVRFGLLTGEVYASADADSEIGAVAVWLPPNARWSRENIQAAGLDQLSSIIGGDALGRYREVVSREAQVRERDMTGPYWYLFLLAVAPERQGRGLGGALIASMLERIARIERLPCYVETEKARNVAFYRRHGFDLIVDGETAGASGVRFWTFQRLPGR